MLFNASISSVLNSNFYSHGIYNDEDWYEGLLISE